jgi:lipopolysaccharide export system permease protein
VKILDKYILKTFFSSFASVFVILFFIFILQGIWLFIADLAGKDLDFGLILKFILFYMPTMIPLVLPLSILLASIMTFGDLSENYEFAAMKSAGVSLMRILKRLTIFITILSLAAFIFANNVIPFAQYKFTNFRRNIAQVKPAMAIAEGQFSEIGIYTIKVDKKSGENGKYLKGITIHKRASYGTGNLTVIKAKDGELISNESSNNLQLILNEGSQYEDVIPKKYEDRNKLPFSKTFFKKYIVNIDLSKLSNTNVDNSPVSNSNTMLNLNELKYTLDSLNKNYKKDIVSFTENIHQRTAINNLKSDLKSRTDSINKIPFSKKNSDLLSYYVGMEKTKIIEAAKGNIVSTNFSIEGTKTDLEFKQKNINSHWLAIYDKFVIAYACFLMFFIGAPLGAIIRKGGLGLPIVFAILIFISFHFINTFGKKVAQENGMTPFLGAWMSSIILTPLAILLTYRATNDIGLISLDRILTPIQNMFKKIIIKKYKDVFKENKA